MTAKTDLVWLREPARRTLLATVTGTRGPAFVLDRSIFAPASHAYRHPQPADRGEVWIGGDKRILVRVHWERGELRHAVRGVTPKTGTKVRLLLDGDRRDDVSDAHAAMHLVLTEFSRRRLGTFTAEPFVTGGRRFTVAARWSAWSPEALKSLLDGVNRLASKPHEVGYEYRTAATAEALQPFQDAWRPDAGPVLRFVHIGKASALPCDGTFPTRTTGVGRVVAAHVVAGREVRVQFQVQRRERDRPDRAG